MNIKTFPALLLATLLPATSFAAIPSENPISSTLSEVTVYADRAQITRVAAIASYAIVMPTSGEDWTDVKLSLSTQNSSKTMKIPELETLIVGAGRKIAKVKGSGSFGVANHSRWLRRGAWIF
ncbi:MAG TPA: hypothetical protein EYQ50_12010 [Verrucomicrobiales bacterium]|nr:hypothetical protein [Verrucomicrobiales bacterium]HIL72579.1 hypothetical protein [Verrucomicrobiota bacterium]